MAKKTPSLIINLITISLPLYIYVCVRALGKCKSKINMKFITTMVIVFMLLISLLQPHHALKDFEYNKLAVAWPPSFCKTVQHRCDLNKMETLYQWSIHGLWPTLADGKSVENCKGEEKQLTRRDVPVILLLLRLRTVNF